MAKRILAGLMLFILLLLGGCRTKNSDYEEPEKRLYVSALGFDRQRGKIKVTAETISISENTSADQYSIKRYSGEGSSVEAAVFDIKKDLVPAPNFSHCAVLLVGENITEDWFRQMVEYCFWDKELTQSVQLVATENAENLLSRGKESGRPLGFSISELMYEDIDGTNSYKDTTLISVVNQLETGSYFQLPFFEVEDKQQVHRGWKVYKGDSPRYLLGRTEMQLLEIAKNNFRSGEIKLSKNSSGGVLNLKSAKSTLHWDSAEGGKLKISVKAKFDSQNADIKPLEKEMSREITRLIASLRREDIDTLEIKEKIKSAYPNLKSGGVDELFRTAPIEVECSIREGDKR